MREAVMGSVPAGTEELNLQAFEKGLEYAHRAAVQPTPDVPSAAVEEVPV